MSDCDHQFEYQGEVTWPDEWSLPGTGARARNYASAYHCTKCCGLRLTNQRRMGTTYEHVLSGAVQFDTKPVSI